MGGRDTIPRRVRTAVETLTVNELLDLMYLLDIRDYRHRVKSSGDLRKQYQELVLQRLGGEDG